MGFESRQVVNIKISRIVTEYRAQVLEDEQGNCYVAAFPEGISRPIQYGPSVKVQAVYFSQYQLIPYERIGDYFSDQILMPVSSGSLFNFNQEAYNLLEGFEELVKQNLIASGLLHSDETGVNISGKRFWLHTAANKKWTHFYTHEKRGTEAMNDIGILPHFVGNLIHDHWKPYYTYKKCTHGLCNAHHIRELRWVIENYPHYTWAGLMKNLLQKINKVVNATENNCLDKPSADAYRARYREIITIGNSEMPLIVPALDAPKKKGRKKKSNERNLLERLRDFEADVLLFMSVSEVPFTNNLGENDLRMTKVQQKISGCFRSMNGAKIFCRIRSYLLTAQKHDIPPTEALETLFAGKLPDKLLSG